MATIIYLVTNRVTGKMYIGLTCQPIQRRWRAHVQLARKGLKTALSAAILKYGAEAFSIIQVATCLSRDVAGKVEADLIRQHGTKAPRGYNLTDGGEGVAGLPREIIERTAAKNRGRKHSDESRALIALAGTGRLKSAQARLAISASRSGKPLSSEHRAKLSAAKLGRRMPPRSDEHRSRISDGLRRAHATRKGAAL